MILVARLCAFVSQCLCVLVLTDYALQFRHILAAGTAVGDPVLMVGTTPDAHRPQSETSATCRNRALGDRGADCPRPDAAGHLSIRIMDLRRISRGCIAKRFPSGHPICHSVGSANE